MLVLTIKPRLLLIAAFLISATYAGECVKVSPADINNLHWQPLNNLDVDNTRTDKWHVSYTHTYTFAHDAAFYSRVQHHTDLRFDVVVVTKNDDDHRGFEIVTDVMNGSWNWKGRPFRVQFVMHSGFGASNGGVQSFDYWIESQSFCKTDETGIYSKDKIPFWAENIKEVKLYRKIP